MVTDTKDLAQTAQVLDSQIDRRHKAVIGFKWLAVANTQRQVS